MPGQEKIPSVMMAPVKVPAICRPKTVMSGGRAFFNPWIRMTLSFLIPRALRHRREAEAGKDHVDHNIAEAFGEIAHTHNRQKIHFNGKLKNQHECQPEDRHGHTYERDDHDNVIEDRILL